MDLKFNPTQASSTFSQIAFFRKLTHLPCNVGGKKFRPFRWENQVSGCLFSSHGKLSMQQGCQLLGTKKCPIFSEKMPTLGFLKHKDFWKNARYSKMGHFSCFIAFLATKENVPWLKNFIFFPKKASKMPVWQHWHARRRRRLSLSHTACFTQQQSRLSMRLRGCRRVSQAA